MAQITGIDEQAPPVAPPRLIAWTGLRHLKAEVERRAAEETGRHGA